jgi:hypothetical protein
MEKLVDDIHQDLRDFIALQKVARMSDQDEECLRDLFVMDPQDDMEIIQNEKKEKFSTIRTNGFLIQMSTLHSQIGALTNLSNQHLDCCGSKVRPAQGRQWS